MQAVSGPFGRGVSADFTNGVAPLSRALWNIDWPALLPLTLSRDGLCVESSSFARATPFILDNYAAIFEEDPELAPFSTSRVTDAKARYYQLFGDFFEIRERERTIGLLICTPLDWSSYYVRSAALLPEYQGRQVIQHFFKRFLFGALRAAGVERVELDTSPGNLAMMHIVTRLRFNVTGTALSERWGAHVHFTKFLSDDSEAVFLRQFCSGVKYQLREHKPAEDRLSQERSSP